MIVEKFEGRVSVRSQLNQGSTFTFSFKLEERSMQAQSVHRIMNLEIPEVYQYIFIHRKPAASMRSHQSDILSDPLHPADSAFI